MNHFVWLRGKAQIPCNSIYYAIEKSSHCVTSPADEQQICVHNLMCVCMPYFCFERLHTLGNHRNRIFSNCHFWNTGRWRRRWRTQRGKNSWCSDLRWDLLLWAAATYITATKRCFCLFFSLFKCLLFWWLLFRLTTCCLSTGHGVNTTSVRVRDQQRYG